MAQQIKAYRASSGKLRIESGHAAVRKAEAESKPTLTVTVKDEGQVTLVLTANGYQERK